MEIDLQEYTEHLLAKLRRKGYLTKITYFTLQQEDMANIVREVFLKFAKDLIENFESERKKDWEPKWYKIHAYFKYESGNTTSMLNLLVTNCEKWIENPFGIAEGDVYGYSWTEGLLRKAVRDGENVPFDEDGTIFVITAFEELKERKDG